MKDDSFVQYVREQLSLISDIHIKRMFGGYGLYSGEKFFSIVYKGRLYFKINENTMQKYVDAGMKPFSPTPRQTLKNYYEVPVDVIEDSSELCDWAEDSIRNT